MVEAIVALFGLVALLTTVVVLNMHDCNTERKRLTAANRRLAALSNEVKLSHEQLVDGLWQRASVEVDQEIERARARSRDS